MKNKKGKEIAEKIIKLKDYLYVNKKKLYDVANIFCHNTDTEIISNFEKFKIAEDFDKNIIKAIKDYKDVKRVLIVYEKRIYNLLKSLPPKPDQTLITDILYYHRFSYMKLADKRWRLTNWPSVDHTTMKEFEDKLYNKTTYMKMEEDAPYCKNIRKKVTYLYFGQQINMLYETHKDKTKSTVDSVIDAYNLNRI